MENLFKKDVTAVVPVSFLYLQDRVLEFYEDGMRYHLDKTMCDKNNNKVSKNIIFFID